VTPFTAYLILEDDRRNGVVANRRLLPALDNAGAVRDLGANFNALKEAKSGAGAVAAARAQQSLTQAKSATYSLRRSNAEAAKPGQGRGFNSYFYSNEKAGGGRATAAQQNIRFVAGRSFYQNGTCWIDAEIQTLKIKTKKIRIKFGSKAYFKLITGKPAALKWISLGKHVEFVLAGTHYEIYEDTKNENN
jgi:hypothetical protein